MSQRDDMPLSTGRLKNSFRSDSTYMHERRQIIKENHPDHGGSDAELIEKLEALDRRWRHKIQASSSLRTQFESVRPDFIPSDLADEAFVKAEEYAERIQRTTETLFAEGQRHAENFRQHTEVIAQSTMGNTVKRKISDAFGTAVQTMQQTLPRGFPGAKRFSGKRKNRE